MVEYNHEDKYLKKNTIPDQNITENNCITASSIQPAVLNEIPPLPDIQRTSVITGDHNMNRQLYYQLKMSMQHAKRIDIIVSFLMESGVRMILKDLKQALDRGAEIRLLTGNYLGITQPGALYLIKSELKDRIDLRFYNDTKRSFHPKAYIFHGEKESEIYIGSSNISRSALTYGIEWNYRFSSRTDKENFAAFCSTFEDLLANHSTIIDDKVLEEYARSWKKPSVQKDLDQNEESEDTRAEIVFQPRGAQIEALYALERTREEGADKALIFAATGVGKTLLAAFDSEKFDHVLFVAHRDEILRQASESFQNVRHSRDYGFFNSKCKDRDKSVIFASVSSLGQSKYLNEDFYEPDYFDYIVVDEFHHAVNDCYRRILDYFHPKFLLGLTATPERMDGRNIYELCDYNVVYEIGMKDAINKGLLVPFHYYGIYDDSVDYSGMHLVKGRYAADDLDSVYKNNGKRYELIYKHYRKYRSERALGFCCTRIHAEKMAEEFTKRGIPSAAVYSNTSGEYSEDRSAAIEKLKNGEIKVIFSVDMFNEGVDIPSVDMVMFLRPTESPVVFLQQLGRGLRRYRNKEYLTVLDFIGNYEKAGNAPFLLSGIPYSRAAAVRNGQQDFEFPDDCIVDFDLRLIDLFQEMARKYVTVKIRIKDEYYRVKDYLGKVPGRTELFTYMQDEVYRLCIGNSAENPFNKYMKFLHDLKELNEEEEDLYKSIGGEFLHVIETTSFSKSYKIPILLAFYNDGNIKMEIDEEDVFRCSEKFYSTGINGKDMEKDKSTRDYKTWGKDKYVSLARRNPVKFLLKSGLGFFVEKEGAVLALNPQLEDMTQRNIFVRQMKDIIDFRTLNFYRNRYEEKQNILT